MGEVFGDESKKTEYTVHRYGDPEETPVDTADPSGFGDCPAWFGEGSVKLWDAGNDGGESGDLLGVHRPATPIRSFPLWTCCWERGMRSCLRLAVVFSVWAAGRFRGARYTLL